MTCAFLIDHAVKSGLFSGLLASFSALGEVYSFTVLVVRLVDVEQVEDASLGGGEPVEA